MTQELTGDERGYPDAILMPHSNIPKNEYTDPTLLPAAFPTLFPYGVGGHEDNFRKQHIPLKQYVKHLLQLDDPKFRHHRSFIFATFDILRRREVASGTYSSVNFFKRKPSKSFTPITFEYLQHKCNIYEAKRANFQRSAELISKLTPYDIKIAIKQEQDKQPITNNAVLELLKNVNIVGKKIMGSCQSQHLLRNEIRAVITRDGSPSLFITINPADLHSSIVMMYAGKEIDINTLLPEKFPTATERAKLAHLDPTAVAKYFNVVVEKMIKVILGYRRPKGGVLGEIKNYYAVIEYQDRGMPYCHMLVWLQGAPNPIELRDRLKSENFRERLMIYVNEIIKEDISYLFSNGDYLTDEMLIAEYRTPKTILEKRIHPSILPIPDLQSPDFDEKFRLDILGIAKRTLFHRCTKSCKKYRRGQTSNCRFDFPHELVEAPGKIYLKLRIITLQRHNACINNHNPYITASCRGNNDIRFIATVKLALAYVHYITDYMTKSDASTHNSFLMCAITLNKFVANVPSSDELSKEFVSRTPKTILEKRIHPSILPIPDLQSPDFDEKFRLDILGIAKRTLFHRCTKSCKKYRRGQTSNCRFDFPHELVEAPGKIYLKLRIITLQRHNACINNHNPYITASCRGNNDIRFIATVKLALAYVHYITDYMTKSDASTHNSFLMCAITLNKFVANVPSSDELSKEFVSRSRKLVTMCLNRIVGQTEMTGPQVSAYLLGFKDHYTPNKFIPIYFNCFETYLTSHYPAEDSHELTLLEDSETDGSEKELDRENDDERNFANDEMFTIISSILTTCIDYMYRGEQLKNICFYDYVSTVHKIKINDKELDKINGQKNREGRATRVDRFLFSGGEKKYDETCEHDVIHPQHSTHMQIHWYHENERIPVLYGRGVPRKDDLKEAERYGLCVLLLFKPWTTADDLMTEYNSWREACEAFLQNPDLSTWLRFVINNIELLHRCAEETTLDRRLRQMAHENLKIAKIRRIERSVVGYNNTDDTEMLDDRDNFDVNNDDQDNSSIDNSVSLNPYEIMCSGLQNEKFINDAVLHLYLKNKFNKKKQLIFQKRTDVLDYDN
ncbi:hypothetical protein Glove_86g42 [Diversispora epigaea]|uniref:Helitron helicase-like domain-containing protein n=1 Tax=Diversispora epigaea TaxID=1348612 RepID=A0A397J925_9GLOM|nr:hypothetical protein Glove_86g42 [Diversispora epigaea]